MDIGRVVRMGIVMHSSRFDRAMHFFWFKRIVYLSHIALFVITIDGHTGAIVRMITSNKVLITIFSEFAKLAPHMWLSCSPRDPHAIIVHQRGDQHTMKSPRQDNNVAPTGTDR